MPHRFQRGEKLYRSAKLLKIKNAKLLSAKASSILWLRRCGLNRRSLNRTSLFESFIAPKPKRKNFRLGWKVIFILPKNIVFLRWVFAIPLRSIFCGNQKFSPSSQRPWLKSERVLSGYLTEYKKRKELGPCASLFMRKKKSFPSEYWAKVARP